jgi:NADH-quinone oxidoreductase subunit C
MDSKQIIELLNDKFTESIFEIDGENAILVNADQWSSIAEFLAKDESLIFNSMMCVTGYDLGNGKLGVAYNMHSMKYNHKLEVRVEVSIEKALIPTVSKIWRTADWHEREIFDLYGIEFEGHEDMTRILLPDDWVGHPLRKDYETPNYYNGIPIPKGVDWE